jgi:hypothetical protein
LAVAFVCAAMTALLAACGGGSSASTAPRPHTDAKLVILTPTPNEVTGPTVPVRFDVQGATVSPPQKNNLAPNEGHIHVTVDGKLVTMAYGTTTVLTGLSPGPHTLQAEFVANDHLPFANRVTALALFTVKA